MIYEIIPIVILGVILHFAYDWSYRNRFVGWFSAVNESTWEHIKIAITATLIATFVDIFWLGQNPNYWIAKTACLLSIIVLIPAIFYGYTALTKKPILWVDIMSFIIVITYSQLIFVKFLGMPELGLVWNIVAGVIGIAILLAYGLFTIWPPRNFLFKDRNTDTYGYETGQYHGSKKSQHK